MPGSATVDEVMEAFVLAWELKCKGITIYRDGSKGEQVLNVGEGSSKLKAKNSKPQLKTQNYSYQSGGGKEKSAGSSKQLVADTCPECGGKLMMQEGCMTCASCGYSACSV